MSTASLTIGELLELLSRALRVERGSTPFGVSDYASIFLPNGWEVSIGFGIVHYCSNYGPPDFSGVLVIDKSPDCELAIFLPGGDWFVPHGKEKEVWPRVPAGDVLAIVDAVATYREDGPCPCPDCVRGRLGVVSGVAS